MRDIAWAIRKLRADGDARELLKGAKIAWELGGEEKPGDGAIDVTPESTQDIHALVLRALNTDSAVQRAEDTAPATAQGACGAMPGADSAVLADAAQLNEDASTTRCELHPTPQRSGTPNQTGEGAIQDTHAESLTYSPINALFEGTDDCDCAVGRCVCRAHLSVGDDAGGPAEGGEAGEAAAIRD